MGRHRSQASVFRGGDHRLSDYNHSLTGKLPGAFQPGPYGNGSLDCHRKHKCPNTLRTAVQPAATTNWGYAQSSWGSPDKRTGADLSPTWGQNQLRGRPLRNSTRHRGNFHESRVHCIVLFAFHFVHSRASIFRRLSRIILDIRPDGAPDFLQELGEAMPWPIAVEYPAC